MSKKEKDIKSTTLDFLASKIQLDYPWIAVKLSNEGKLTKETLEGILIEKNVLQSNGRPVPFTRREEWFKYHADPNTGISHFIATVHGYKCIVDLLDGKEVGLQVIPHEIADAERLNFLEEIVMKGKDTFFAVGLALREIKEKKLYKLHSGTFEIYMRKRFGFTRQRGYQLISNAETIVEAEYDNNYDSVDPSKMSTYVYKNKNDKKRVLTTDLKTRPLKGLKPDQKQKVVQAVSEKAESENREVTVDDLKLEVSKYKEPKVNAVNLKKDKLRIISDTKKLGVRIKSFLTPCTTESDITEIRAEVEKILNLITEPHKP